jgi:FKBP-type peptidyl-prolyl cis-trans isomerase SlyD
MNENNKGELSVKDDLVVGLEYTLRVDGQDYEQTAQDDPLYFIQGQEQVIPGLECQLYGMKVGESKNFQVSPGDAYGEFDPEAVGTVPRSEFPDKIPLEKDTFLQLRDGEGEELSAYVEDFNDQNVMLNFNHPLAGKELSFTVKVTNLRPATREELEHGHVHE